MSRSSSFREPRSGWRLRDRRGLAVVEFALTVPILLVLLLAGYDVVIWLRTWLQMESAAGQVAQIIAQYPTLYASDFTGTFYPVAQSGAGSATLACNNGSMVVSGIDNTTGTPTVSWQWKSGSCSASRYVVKDNSCAASGYATADGSGKYTLCLPSGYLPPTGFAAIAIELSTTQPAYVFSSGLLQRAGFANLASIVNIGTYAITVPRSNALPALTPGNRPG